MVAHGAGEWKVGRRGREPADRSQCAVRPRRRTGSISESSDAGSWTGLGGHTVQSDIGQDEAGNVICGERCELVGHARVRIARDQHEQSAQHVDRPQPEPDLRDSVVRSPADGVQPIDSSITVIDMNARAVINTINLIAHYNPVTGAITGPVGNIRLPSSPVVAEKEDTAPPFLADDGRCLRCSLEEEPHSALGSSPQPQNDELSICSQ